MKKIKNRGCVTIQFDDKSKPIMELSNIHPDKMLSFIEEFIKMGYITVREATPVLSAINKALKKEPPDYLLGGFAGVHQ